MAVAVRSYLISRTITFLETQGRDHLPLARCIAIEDSRCYLGLFHRNAVHCRERELSHNQECCYDKKATIRTAGSPLQPPARSYAMNDNTATPATELRVATSSESQFRPSRSNSRPRWKSAPARSTIVWSTARNTAPSQEAPDSLQ
jgi:hypothetical protein